VLAWITPNVGLPDGRQGLTVVSAWNGTVSLGTFELGWKVSSRPKLFYVVLDALGPRYLGLNRIGRERTGPAASRRARRSPPWAEDPLMPRALELLPGAAFFTNARSVLPATTDPNHMAALTGSWPGTIGIHSVSTYYGGRDDQDRPISLDGSKALLRTGSQGDPVRTVFDVSKDPQAGGTPDAFNLLIAGKSWLVELVRDTAGTVDIAASGLVFPSYVPPPPQMRLGDPPSDPDADRDREGTNLGPRLVLKRYSAQAQLIGRNPGLAPDDRWVAEAAVRMIMAEDPDVAYVALTETDTVQHVFGAADRPEEWTDPASAAVLWDDVNVFNPNANRDPVLDVVHEADYSLGYVVDALRARGAFERSYFVLMSDHGQVTQMNSALRVPDILLAKGIPAQDVERVTSSGEQAWIYLRNPANAAAVEPLLEGHEERHPVTGQAVRPFLVINRAEMDAGMDAATGTRLEDGLAGNRRGELYSEWCIDAAPAPGVPRVRWPDLFVFNRDHFQNRLLQADDLDGGLFGLVFNGHHGSPQSSHVVLAVSGPRIAAGTYDTPASLADILPTLYPLLGLQPPPHVDGGPLSAAVRE
jgi:predicted AlkP superfamily pyrophosphatase or phosphodiesterase